MKVHVRGTVGVRGGDECRHSRGDDGIVSDELRTEGSELDRGSESLHGIDGRENMSSGMPFDERLDGEFDPQHEDRVGRGVGSRTPERHHSRHRSRIIASSPADSWEQKGEAVGKKLFDSARLLEFATRNPPGLGDLAIGEDERSVGDHLKTTAIERDRIIVEGQRPPVIEFEEFGYFDTDLFGQFAMGGDDVGLAGRDDPADGDIAPPGPDVFGRRTSVDE